MNKQNDEERRQVLVHKSRRNEQQTSCRKDKVKELAESLQARRTLSSNS
ncbi:MAG: hypothetical protein IJ207_03455 [Treponema sp.]|nr:hypothetical protein [Treponema sp.]MBQ9281235.1 hypothetical protein [Treponema sp.]